MLIALHLIDTKKRAVIKLAQENRLFREMIEEKNNKPLKEKSNMH